jgi:iron complex outermembrane recepter protein
MHIHGLPVGCLALGLAGLPMLAATAGEPAAPERLAATAAGASAAAEGPAASASSATTDGSTKLEEVVVTGIRASLERSIEIKKDAPVVLDSINATELGRFPDADVADSLSHLPGVTITRTTGGEGQKVSIRGLGFQYNITTLNNRILATDDDARELAFDVLPSELISGADVLKSSQASALEGSIGGTVNLRTASAFDNPGLHMGVHAEGDYNQMSTLHGTKYSAFASDTNEARTMGFVLGLVHSDNNIRTDSLNAYNQNIYGPQTYPFEGGPGAVPLTATPCCITFGSIFDDKKRDALSGSLEWRPSSDFKLAADGLFTRLRDPQIGYNESYYFPYTTDQNGNPTWSNAVAQNGLITAVTANEFQPEMVNNTINRNVDTWLAGLNASWKPIERLSLGLDFYRSVAKRPEGGADTFVTAGLVTDQPYAQDIINVTDLPHSLPSLNVVIPPGQLGLSACPAGTASTTNPGSCSYTALMNSGFLNNNKYWSTHYVGMNGYSVHDQVTGLTLDGSFDLKWGVFDRLLFGVGGSHREKERTDSSNDWTNGSGQYGTLYTTAGCDIQCNPYSFASQGFNVVSMVSPPNFMQGAGGSFPTVLPRLNANQLFGFLRSLDGKPNPFYCQNYPSVCQPPYTPFNFANTLPQPNPYNSYDVIEKTLSFYLEGDFEADNWSGNLGVRLIQTKTAASTAVAVPSAIWTPFTTGSTQTWNVVYGNTQPIGANGKYTLALPSANFNYWVLPQTLQARFAVAETMSRPNLNQLAPTSTNNALNGQPQLYYNGTAGLKPVKAWQADISIEWYYQPHAALALALFGKKIRDDIYTGVQTSVNLGTLQYYGGQPGTVPGTPFLWTVQAPANGTKSTFTGYELTWQHILDNGFGIHAQYTHTQTKSYDQFGAYAGPINAAPPTTVSIGLIYEKGPLSADVNWDYASSYTYYCSECTEVPGWPAISDSFKWLTASLHYKFLKNFEVYVEGKNLTNAIARTYLNGNPLLPWAPGQSVGESTSGVGVGYSAYGRSYVAGLAFRF